MSHHNTLPALFIGRFQPFHLGHFDVVSQLVKNYGAVLIGIGSAQYSGTPQNPFPAELRERMILESLTGAGISADKFTIVKIPDIHNDDMWVAHVEKLCPPFNDVWSGTPKVQELFKKNGKHTVHAPVFNYSISATQIRERIARGEKWEDMVPVAVVRIINNERPSAAFN